MTRDLTADVVVSRMETLASEADGVRPHTVAAETVARWSRDETRGHTRRPSAAADAGRRRKTVTRLDHS